MGTGAGLPPARVFLVEYQQMLADGLKHLLGAEPDMEVVGQASTGSAALEAVSDSCPDVVIVNEVLPGGGGVSVARRIIAACPGIGVVLISEGPEEDIVAEAVTAGCSAVVAKSRHYDDLYRSVRAVANGHRSLPFDALHRLARPEPKPPASVELTDRELAVLECLADGLTNEAIGQRLGLSVNTVGNHLQHLLAKLGAHSKLEALVLGLRLGLVELGDR